VTIADVDPRSGRRRCARHVREWAGDIIGQRRKQGHRGDRSLRARCRIEDVLEAVKSRLVTAGAEIGDIQRLGSEGSLFFRDPDGMELEVCAKADDE
jgi:catechol 2,3-dioxygenase-like lactoylglutathione lyase family enzyme